MDTQQTPDFDATLIQHASSDSGIAQSDLVVYVCDLNSSDGQSFMNGQPCTATITGGNVTSVTFSPIPAAEQLSTAQTNKSKEITNAEAADINGGFTSSALGAVHTYLSDESSMLLLTGEYAYVKGSDYDGNPIPWYTKESGYTNHTQAQFVQMYLDGRKATQLKKVKGDTKRKQVAQCTTTDQVATIAYPTNPNPPSIPAGLTGTAGTQQVSLSWTANTDVTMIGGGGYNVYQNGTKINTSLVTTNSFTVTGLTTGTSYKFTITAVDTDGLESAQCTAVSVTAN